jgi:PspA associated protein B
MGLLDTILGRSKPVRANLDALFALPSAAVTLETSAGLTLSGRAGVCWKPPAGQAAQDVQHEIEELLAIDDTPGSAEGSTAVAGSAGAGPSSPGASDPQIGALHQAVDAYGYRWLLLDDSDSEDLVTRVHLVNSSLTDAGWGPQLLCSVFGVTPTAEGGPDAKAFYLVYLYKRGTFYPFAPDGKEHRDNELELRMRAVVGSDLPVEDDLSRWFPLWDLPVPLLPPG